MVTFSLMMALFKMTLSLITAPLPIRTPGDMTEFMTVPSMIHPLDTQLCLMTADSPTLTGGKSSLFV